MKNTFVSSVKTIAQSLIDKAGFDKTRSGKIVAKNDMTNTYSVRIDGNIYPTIHTMNDATYNVGDTVKVKIPCGQMSQAYITSSIFSDASIGKKIGHAEKLIDAIDGSLEDVKEIDGHIYQLDIVSVFGASDATHTGHIYKDGIDVTDSTYWNKFRWYLMESSGKTAITDGISNATLTMALGTYLYGMALILEWVDANNNVLLRKRVILIDNDEVSKVMTKATNAYNLADNTDNYFWMTTTGTDTGAHITLQEQDQFKTMMADTTHYTDADIGYNMLAKPQGLVMRYGRGELAHFTSASLDFQTYQNGTLYKTAEFTPTALTFYNENEAVAKFGQNVIIGKDDGTQSYLELDYNSITFYDKERSEFFKVEDLRNEYGYVELSETFSQSQVGNKGFVVNYPPMSISTTTVKVDNVIVSINYISGRTVVLVEAPPLGSSVSIEYRCADANLKAYTLGKRISDSVKGPYSFVEGYNNLAEGMYSYAEGYYTGATGHISHAEGMATEASGDFSHAEGSFTKSSGRYSHAEGDHTEASGIYSHAEGYYTKASGRYSHAEGSYTETSGDNSHAEGDHTEASGNDSHAEGSYTEANGDYSHAGGCYTKANGNWEYVIGRYNIPTLATSKRIGYYMCTTENYDDESIYIPVSNLYGVYALYLDVYFNGIDISNSRWVQFSDSGVTIFRQAVSGERFYDGDEIEVYTSIYFPNAFVIGNGDSNNRNNALTVDWEGRISCGDYSGNFKSIFDIFYPVGSYYETSDNTFDPNTAWGGTWELEAEGLVHIGAGQTYSVGATGGEAAHVLTPSETATKNHSHTLPNHTHGMSDNLYYLTMNYETVNSGAGETQVATSSSSQKYALTNGNSRVDFAAKKNTANPNSNPSTGGNPVDADATSAHNNMQPYVVVNRWHRTA